MTITNDILTMFDLKNLEEEFKKFQELYDGSKSKLGNLNDYLTFRNSVILARIEHKLTELIENGK